MIHKKRHNFLRGELAQCCTPYGNLTSKEVDGITSLDPGVTFDLVNFGEG